MINIQILSKLTSPVFNGFFFALAEFNSTWSSNFGSPSWFLIKMLILCSWSDTIWVSSWWARSSPGA